MYRCCQGVLLGHEDKNEWEMMLTIQASGGGHIRSPGWHAGLLGNAHVFALSLLEVTRQSAP